MAVDLERKASDGPTNGRSVATVEGFNRGAD